MANLPWLDDVRRRLVANDLPPDYIRRFLEELTDHLEDLTEETMSKEANVASRLGEPDQLAESAVVAYRRRTFFGRHPSAKFWVFCISPLPAMFAVFVTTCLGVMAFGAICERCGVRLADHDYLGGVDPTALGWLFSAVTTIAPASLLTWLYCRFAKRFHIDEKWMLTACGVLAFVAMLPIQNIALSDMPGESLWSIGLRLPPDFLQCIQLLAPVAIGLWCMRRADRPPQHEEHLSAAA